MLRLTLLLATLTLTQSAPAAPLSGDQYFKRSCALCHSTDAAVSAGAGPGLAGIFGRALGAAPGYNYSDALRRAGAGGKRWDAAMLDAFLDDPAKAVPGTTMPLNVPAKAERAALVAYLGTLAAGTPAVAAAGAMQWVEDAPGKVHHLDARDLPAPYASASAGNSPKVVPRPEGAMPRVPAGFKISLFATDADKGRSMIRAPNGDVLIAAPGKGQIKLLRSSSGERAETVSVFAGGLDRPYGMAFYPSGGNPRYLYVATLNQVVRLPYSRGALTAGAAPQVVVPALTVGSGGHTTRTLAFSADDKLLFVSIGSASNVATGMPAAPPQPLADWEREHGVGAAWGDELDRAAVLAFDPEGGHRHTYATGLRNCVGMIVYPATGELMCSVNERDALGDQLPPDYVTRVANGSFYGWPWYYIGAHEDPRLAGRRPDLKSKVRMPDVLLQAHSAPLGMTAYVRPEGARHPFPQEYEGDLFVALHGSWNRATRTGSKVVRVMMKNGVP
ncbi:MAG: PQQ-dependent sugar dehydrogenase, partial [Pseudomonadota bacterium]|nr:PQQ-dependent sugar dehydrogenase [Pseudomonadota bacterium]